MAEYSIELSYNNHEVFFQIPILPEEIEIEGAGNGETHDVAGLGEINVIKAPKLKEISFSGVFPAEMSSAIQSVGFEQPADFIMLIEDWMNKKRPIRFIYVSDSLKINIPVSIEDFNYKEVGGAVGDWEYELSLKEFVFYAARKVVFAKTATTTTTNKTTTKTATKTEPKRADERAKAKTVTIKSGDTLWIIAKKNLGDGSRYKEIQKLNGITDAQAKKLKIGTVIKLPG
ncbi:nucleoid-associated protein YgaU [Paenibacillus sp. DS2015]|uniref:LysM peptidoglycan-binding domain-containing protein n=1 Tax=Paenibacillus sp. DS2015 TaxID=3373917 RepID=UPI003D1EAFBA